MGASCPGRHLTSLRPWYHADLLRNHGLHCRGVTRGARGHNYSGAESLWGRRKSQHYHKCILQYSTKISGLNMEAPKLLLEPGAIYPRYAPAALAAYLKLVFGFASCLNRASVIGFPLHS